MCKLTFNLISNLSTTQELNISLNFRIHACTHYNSPGFSVNITREWQNICSNRYHLMITILLMMKIYIVCFYNWICILITLTYLPAGATQRHYESRRRAILDSVPARQSQVRQNKEKAKRKGFRTRVCWSKLRISLCLN